MSFNRLKLRSLAIPQEIQPLSHRDPTSGRTKSISLLSSRTLMQAPPITDTPYIDIDISGNITKRTRSKNSKKEQLPGALCLDKENINCDADDLFDNFDRCYRASFCANEGTVSKNSKDNKGLPVCRDLLSEFAADASKSNNSNPSGTKTPLALGNNSYFQRPKEFQVSKAGKYFDMKTPGNAGMNRPHIGFGAKKEEDVENEDEEERQINVKNVLVVRNNHYEIEQRTLNKMKKLDYKIDIPNKRRILDDVTNNVGKQTHRGSVQATGESNRFNLMELFTRRETISKETLGDKRRHSCVHSGNNETKKLNIPGMLGSLQKKESLHPPARNSYNGKGYESHRVVKPSKVNEKPESTSREVPNKNQSKSKAVATDAKNNTKAGNENKALRNSIKTYESLLKYFEIAKKELGPGDKNIQRSSSEHRR